jgi:Dolichyl-phosphate-mannose-protein mannosyltransferase
MTVLQGELKRSYATNSVASSAAIYIAIFALLAAYFMVWPIWRSQFLIEIWLTEAWNAYFQDAAVSATRLYPDASSLTVNNYPPLSFYFVGVLGRIFGDVLFVGRAVSIAGLLVVAFEVFLCVRILTGGRVGATIGALWYVAIMSHNFTTYVGANDPQIAGEAIMGAGLVLMLLREKAKRSVTPALLLMVVGGFWKHNMIGIPLTAVGWLLLNHGRKSIGPIVISAVASAAGLLACYALYGREFFENLLVARDYSFDHVVGNIGHLQWSAAAAIIWAFWAATNRSTSARFTRLHVPIGLFACLLQWLGSGVFGNAEFDLILALGIAVGVTFEGIKTSVFAKWFGINAAQGVMVAILGLRLIASDRQEPVLVVFSPDFRSQLYAAERFTRADADRIAAMPGDVYCPNKVACRLAGKRFVVDDFKVEQMVATHAITKPQLDEIMETRNIATFAGHSPGAIDTSLSRWMAR